MNLQQSRSVDSAKKRQNHNSRINYSYSKMYQYGHTFILHNKLVANYKLIYFKCFESNNK